MSEAPNTGNVRNDEIDLLDLFRRMGRAFGRMFRMLGRWILISIVFLIRNWLPLGISIFLGLGSAYLLRQISSSTYTSDLVLRTNTIPASDMISYINRLHTYCKENNKPALAQAISLPSDQVKNIIDVGAYWIIDKNNDGTPDEVDYKDNHNIYDTLNIRMQDRLDVRVRIKSPQELSMVTDGILRFIDSDSLFQQRNRVRLRQNAELMIRLDYDIEQLDSLQKIKYFQETKKLSQPGSGQILFLQEQKTQLIYPEIQDLFRRKQSLDADMTLYKNLVTVLSEFSIPARRDNGTTFYAVRMVPFFFFLTLLILIAIANRDKIKELYRKY